MPNINHKYKDTTTPYNAGFFNNAGKNKKYNSIEPKNTIFGRSNRIDKAIKGHKKRGLTYTNQVIGHKVKEVVFNKPKLTYKVLEESGKVRAVRFDTVDNVYKGLYKTFIDNEYKDIKVFRLSNSVDVWLVDSVFNTLDPVSDRIEETLIK